MMAPCGREPAAGPPLLSPRVFVGRAQLSGDPVPPRAAAPLCPRPGLQTLAWTAPRSALVSLDGCARPPGSPRSLFWGSRLRKVRGTVPSDLFKGLAASRLPPPPFRLHPLRRPVSPHSFPFTGFDCFTAFREPGTTVLVPTVFVSVSVAGWGRWACERGPVRPLCGLPAKAAGGQRLPEVLWGARRYIADHISILW